MAQSLQADEFLNFPLQPPPDIYVDVYGLNFFNPDFEFSKDPIRFDLEICVLLFF